MTGEAPQASVIIPTYNRKGWLRDTLDSLSRQTWPAEKFEVIVVDDGSTDGTEEVARLEFPFHLRYIRQANQGDAEARNRGARHSQAERLVFLDDDILLAPQYLESVMQELDHNSKKIVVGADILWTDESNPLDRAEQLVWSARTDATSEPLPFVEVCSNNMSLYREAYFTIGMMEGLNFSGSSIWCDVDFAYRAYHKGFEFVRSCRAVCWHRDYVARSFEKQKARSRETAFRAVALFHKYPDLVQHLPMFLDKTPIDLKRDAPPLIARKLLRKWSSTRLSLAGLEWIASAVEKGQRFSVLLRPLHRWILGGYLYRGYHEGLKRLGPVTK